MGDNAETTQEIFEVAWQGRNFEIFDEVAAGHCAFIDPSAGPGDTDKAGYAALMQRFDDAFDILEIGCDEHIDAGDVQVLRWSMIARMVGPLQGISPTGRTGSTSGMAMFRFVNGKLIEHRTVWDTLSFFRGIGLVTEVPARSEPMEAQPDALF